MKLLGDRVLGRVVAQDVHNPDTQELVFEAGHLITEDDVETITKLGIDEMMVRTRLPAKLAMVFALSATDVTLAAVHWLTPVRLLGLSLPSQLVNRELS